jgi:hypothetical protein
MKNLILISLVCSALCSSAACYLGIKPIANEPSCYGAATGSIRLSLVGGTAPYNFAWSGGLPNSIVQNNLTAGTYSVTVTDANELTASYAIILEQPFQIQINPVAYPPQAHGADDGSIQTSVDGGTPAYAYLWSNGATTSGLSGLVAGDYGLTVTDAAGCTIRTHETLSQPSARVTHDFGKQSTQGMDDKSLNTTGNSNANNSAIAAMSQLKDEDVQVYPNPTGNTVTVKTGDVNNAQITITDLNGKIVSQLKSESNETNLNLAALANGNYIIEIRTDDGSIVNKTVTLAR